MLEKQSYDGSATSSGDPKLLEATADALSSMLTSYDNYLNSKGLGKEYRAATYETYLGSKDLYNSINTLYQNSKTSYVGTAGSPDDVFTEVSGSYFGGASLKATPTVQSFQTPVSLPPPPIKTAPIDTILFDDETTPIEIMTDLIFENIGGQELISIARNDTINGQKIIYQPIKNLTTIEQRYNPNNILSVQDTSDKYFSGFSIKLNEKIPNVGNGQNGENVYLDPDTGDLIIELVNMSKDEQVESQISISGTIYEADI